MMINKKSGTAAFAFCGLHDIRLFVCTGNPWEIHKQDTENRVRPMRTRAQQQSTECNSMRGLCGRVLSARGGEDALSEV